MKYTKQIILGILFLMFIFPSAFANEKDSVQLTKNYTAAYHQISTTITILSLEDALNYAEQDIKDRWEFYKERYLKKLKK